MAELIRLPKMGLTMEEGTIVEWFVEEGQEVKKGERFFEVATDKISNEIEAEFDTTLLKIIVAKDEDALVQAPIAIVGQAGEDYSALMAEAGAAPSSAPAEELEAEEAPVAAAAAAATRAPGEYVLASPLAKKTAKEKGVDLAMIAGTGPSGRVVEKDVLAAGSVKASPMAKIAATELGVNIASIQKDGRIMKDDVQKYYRNSRIEDLAEPSDDVKPMSRMRKVVAKRMTESWNMAPAVTYDISIDMTKLIAMKKELKPFAKITYTDLIVKILSRVLLKHKALNCNIDGNNIIERNYVNMGVAVATDTGLLVPVVKYSNIKSLGDISAEIKELAEKGRTNQLGADALQGGTFTVSNMGMYEVESFSPIINQPETAILGICGIKNTPVVNDAMEIEIKPLMKLCLTADHRVVDGAVAAMFLKDLKEHLENPAVLLI